MKVRGPDAFKDFNNAHDRGPEHQYGSTRLADTPNGSGRYTAKRFPDVLRAAADLVEQHGTDPRAMADLYCFLANAKSMMPEIPDAWCTIKNYRDDSSLHTSRPDGVVWTAHLTEEQANEFAPAIENHYWIKSAKRWRDTWTVEQRWAPAIDFVHPDCTVDRYLRSLG
jgi:hypothetical protein